VRNPTDVCANAHMCHCTDTLLWAHGTGVGWITTDIDRLLYREQHGSWQVVSAVWKAADHGR
jgi:hypothetical protein